MTQTARTNPSATPVIRFPFVAAAAAASLVVAVAMVASSIPRDVAAPRAPEAPSLIHATGYAGNLQSEYLIEISQEWAPIPVTFAQQRLLNDLNSEYLRKIGATFLTPMTREQARLRGELNSEYLREAALGW